MKKRGLITIVVLVVTVIFLLRCVPIPAHAEGPAGIRGGAKVWVGVGSWGYYDPACNGKEGEKMKDAFPVQYYRSCIFPRKPGGFEGEVRPKLFRGYRQNGTIRVCTTGWFWWCRWYPKEAVFPSS